MGEVKDVGEYLGNSDIFVLASRAEGMSNSLLEAMSQGLACIATKISGNVELFGVGEGSQMSAGEFEVTPNGILVNPEDVDALSEAILFLVRDPELRQTLAHNARKHIEENCSIDLIAEKYINLYHHILKGTQACAESAGS
jgi:glycosyltransferase involved in cell wall biosynthesis